MYIKNEHACSNKEVFGSVACKTKVGGGVEAKINSSDGNSMQ